MAPDNALTVTGLFLTLHTANELSVDTSRGEKLEINVRLCPQSQSLSPNYRLEINRCLMGSRDRHRGQSQTVPLSH